MGKLICSKCGKSVIALHPGNLCAKHYNFKADRERDLSKVERQVKNKKKYDKNPEALKKRARDRARRLSKQRSIAKAKELE